MNNLKTAFDSIKAEDALKANTVIFLQKEIQKRNRMRYHITFRKFALAFASVFIVIISGFYTHNLYFTPTAFVDVDVNPSIELTLNQFDRVIGAYAYNHDGGIILENVSVRHKKYVDAIGILINEMVINGFTQEDGLVSVTLQIDDTEREIKMLSAIESVVHEHHGTAQINAFSVGSHTRHNAHELNLSPAMYLAIQELIEVDPTATVDSCREHTIREIRQLTEMHSAGHHSSNVSPEPINGNNSEQYHFENDNQVGIPPDNEPYEHHNEDKATGSENQSTPNSNTHHGSGGHGRGRGHD